MLQHQFGVVAAGFVLDHRGDAGRRQPRQQHRRFDLRRRHRRAVDDRQRIARALSASAAGGRRRRRRRPGRPSTPADRGCGASAGCAARHRHRTIAVIGQPATAPMTSRQPVPELPKSSGASGCAKPADTDAAHRQATSPGPLHLRAQRPHRLGGVEHVLALEQAGDPGLADRQRPQNQRAMRNRLVAGHADASRSRRPLERASSGGEAG